MCAVVTAEAETVAASVVRLEGFAEGFFKRQPYEPLGMCWRRNRSGGFLFNLLKCCFVWSVVSEVVKLPGPEGFLQRRQMRCSVGHKCDEYW
jgi:hypothetical protein